jgi:hypothetical protein
MGDGSFVRHQAFGSHKTLHTIGMVVHNVSRLEQRRLPANLLARLDFR